MRLTCIGLCRLISSKNASLAPLPDANNWIMAVTLVMKKFSGYYYYYYCNNYCYCYFVAYTVTDCWRIVTSHPKSTIGATVERTIPRRYDLLIFAFEWEGTEQQRRRGDCCGIQGTRNLWFKGGNMLPIWIQMPLLTPGVQWKADLTEEVIEHLQRYIAKYATHTLHLCSEESG
jgi:hypothetical protein